MPLLLLLLALELGFQVLGLLQELGFKVPLQLLLSLGSIASADMMRQNADLRNKVQFWHALVR